MSELRDLYQEMILDHNRSPRNFGEPAASTCHADGFNPLCGDTITVYLTVEDDVIRDVSFVGSGCAISTASASMMTEALKGKTATDARELFDRFHGLVTTDRDDDDDELPDVEEMGKLAVFAGVSEYPMRVKCATLAWHTLQAALKADGSTATTE